MPVTKTLHKRFNSFEQEEQWLNELAACGWRLVKYGDGEFNIDYTFELDLTIKGMHYKIDFRMLRNKSEFEDYVTLFEETGWKPVASKWNNNKYIFTSAELMDIYSDEASLIERERQSRKIDLISISVVCVAIICCAIWYYLKRIDFLPGLLICYSGAVIYFGWKIWKKTKKIKQLRG